MTTFTPSVSNAIDNSSKIRLYLVFFIIISIAISWLGVIDKQSTDYIDGALVQAGLAFTGAKAINALVSVLQTITLSIGVASVSPGEMLDPINDLVEHYSELMKLAIGSLLLQKILLEVVSDNAFKVLLTLAGVMSAISLFIGNFKIKAFLLRLFLFSLFLRFSLIFVVALNGATDYMFLNEKTEQQIQGVQLDEADDKLSYEQRQALLEEMGLLKEKVSNLDDQLSKKLAKKTEIQSELTNVEEKISNLKKELSGFQFFNKDPRLIELELERDKLDDALELVTDEGKKLEREKSALNKEIEFAQLTLDGKAGGFFGSFSMSSFGSSITAMKDAVSIDKLMETKEKIENMTTAFLTLISLFVLKTLILPLLFLFVVVRLFKAVWQIDPARYIPALKPLSGGKAAE